MTSKQKQLLESYIEKQVRKHLNEGKIFDDDDINYIRKKLFDISKEIASIRSGYYDTDFKYIKELEKAEQILDDIRRKLTKGV